MTSETLARRASVKGSSTTPGVGLGRGGASRSGVEIGALTEVGLAQSAARGHGDLSVGGLRMPRKVGAHAVSTEKLPRRGGWRPEADVRSIS